MRIGLIAGNGQFPILFAKGAKARGHQVVAIAVREEAEPDLENYVDKIIWISVGEMAQFFEILKKENFKKMVMAGQIRPTRIFEKNISKDARLRGFLNKVKDKRADSLLGTIAKMLKKMGIQLLNSSTFLKDYLVPPGVLTKLSPTARQWEDINFGRRIAKRIAALDIGQTVVVKDKAILAIEAIEGTDETIKRAGGLCSGQAVVVKVSKPHQDMRFDIPLVGPKTIDSLIAASSALLAMEAGKTLFLDKEKCLDMADEKGICLIGI